jgi:DNA-binding ferritin-like protein
MPSRRTVRKPTVWTPEEWRHIEEAAAACCVRPLRYVRQAALAAELPPGTRGRGARALLHEFTAVLDTLHQLLQLAQAAGDRSTAAALESTIRITNEAAEAATTRRGSAEPLIIAVREAGRVLDGLARQARAAEALPADEELSAALVSIQIAALGAARVTLGGLGTAVRSISTPSRRTIRKTTVWTPDEWRHIEEEARTRGVPPMRHVREVALAAKLPPHTRRRRVHALVRELKWVLNNLHQLLHLAEDDGAPAIAAALEGTIRITQDAAKSAIARRSSTESLVVAVREAGRVLNELTHQAHIAGALPAGEELGAALVSIQFAALNVTR